ncbi:LysR family transcriptional regulator [Acidiphilium sp. PM]|nr:LysR family transcriptional regulator [Acidiphilium sp. PM]
MKIVPFCEPQIYRQIGIVQAASSPKADFFAEVHRRLADMAGAYGAHRPLMNSAKNI